MSTTKDFSALLKSAKLPERTVEICLRGDLVAEHEEAERQLEQAQRAQGDSLAGNGAGAIAERIEALEAEMREASYTFRLRALSRPAWRDLLKEHPPRRGEDGEMLQPDGALGIDSETFFAAMIRACLVDPALTVGQWSELEQALTDRQFDTLSDAAWALNRREVDIPFSRAASRMRQASAAE